MFCLLLGGLEDFRTTSEIILLCQEGLAALVFVHLLQLSQCLHNDLSSVLTRSLRHHLILLSAPKICLPEKNVSPHFFSQLDTFVGEFFERLVDSDHIVLHWLLGFPWVTVHCFLKCLRHSSFQVSLEMLLQLLDYGLYASSCSQNFHRHLISSWSSTAAKLSVNILAACLTFGTSASHLHSSRSLRYLFKASGSVPSKDGGGSLSRPPPKSPLETTDSVSSPYRGSSGSGATDEHQGQLFKPSGHSAWCSRTCIWFSRRRAPWAIIPTGSSPK